MGIPIPTAAQKPIHRLATIDDANRERWIVARRNQDGTLWLDTRHTATSPDDALALARMEDRLQPQWSRINAVAAIVLVKLTVVEQRDPASVPITYPTREE